MSNPKNPNDPDALSLAPSGGKKKADFSNVKGRSDSVPGTRSGGGGPGAKPDFSNVKGGSDTVPAGAGQTYTVQKGDTLSHIAKQFYGKAGAWNRIFEANRDQLDNPDLIQPGQVLRIPAKAD